MIPGRIEGANVTLGAPENYDGQVLAAGAPVRLTMHSSRHPPVKLGVGEVPS